MMLTTAKSRTKPISPKSSELVNDGNRKPRHKHKGKSKVSAPRNPKLVKESMEDDKKSPSAFLAEMSMTTQERLKSTYEMRVPEVIELLDMSEMTLQKNTAVDLEGPLFQPFPSEIVFQNFEPQQMYRVPLHLRNNDQVGRLIKVVQEESPYFSIISPPDIGHKVAPGMDTIFFIQFMADQKMDYVHEIICITEREKFLIPVKAIGARGILDFPDEVHFGTCPVKHVTSKTLLVRNIGNMEARFNLLVESSFSVTPDSGVLEIGACMQVEIYFKSHQTGSCKSHLIIQYDTGEEIFVALYGDAVDVNVRLDKNTIRLDNTYITNASKRCISIVNRSDIIVQFAWKSYATVIEEEQQKQSFYRTLECQGSSDTNLFLEECIADPTIRDQFSLVIRSIKNKVKVTADNKMLFANDNITVNPLEGEIWPNSSIDINVIFRPDEAKTFSTVAYCDISGRETRLPLRIRGEGIGPKIQFSFDTLDIENVFVNSEHSYEVIVVNKGDIDAIFSYVPSNSLFGQQFVFTPTNGTITAGDYQAVQIYFSSPHLGQVSERFYWNVEGSAEQFTFLVRGCVIGPTFHFDIPRLKFGTVSYGFTYKKTCKLINTSMISMAFNLRVPDDGIGIRAVDIAKSFMDLSLEVNNFNYDFNRPSIEFEIFPQKGVLLPSSEIEIMVCFTPLKALKYESVIVVDVEGVGADILALPISAKCIVPTIEVVTPVLDFGRCFIRHSYERIIELSNSTDLPAKYELVAQVDDDQCSVSYSSPMPRGIIEPGCIFEVPIHIILHTIEEAHVVIYFSIYGSKQPPLQIQVHAIGEGPVIHLNTQEINYGMIPVLADSTRVLTLSNESLIPAQFYCEMVRTHSLFCVEPESAVIDPEASIQLNITANINDCIKFQDKLAINVIDSKIHTVYLEAHGSGTTITSEPCFGPVWDVGPQLSSRKYSQKFRFYNKGRRPQQIYWMTQGFAPRRARKKQEYNTDDMKYKNRPPSPEPPTPVFRLIPDRLSLAPGKYHDAVLEGYSELPQTVKERMICQAIVGNASGKEKIMTVDVHANFIQPLLSFSEKNLNFHVIKDPDSTLVKQSKPLTVKNISMLPLRTIMKVEYPFQILQYVENQPENTEMSEIHLTLDRNEEKILFIQFDPCFVNNQYSRKAESKLDVVYKDHPSTDSIILKGDVYYPNLEFETTNVTFNTVLNDTEHVITVRVTNISPLDVLYSWSFKRYNINFDVTEEDEGLGNELSDTSDEENHKDDIFTNNIAITGTNASQGSFIPMLLDERPRTSQSLPCRSAQKRPASAPATCNTFEDVRENYGAITWKQVSGVVSDVGIEEVFDILPLYGCLKSSESQQFQFSFYGHSYIMAEAIAICSVKGGPDYEIQLSGHASLVQYKFSEQKINFGHQLYDQLNCYNIKLHNIGKVNFDFVVLDVDPGDTPQPGVVNVSPSSGYVKCGESVSLSIKYIAGVPEVFSKIFKIRVAYFEPEILTVYGVGVFPHVMIDLPKDIISSKYIRFYEEAKMNVINDMKTENENVSSKDIELSDHNIQMEVDRLEVQQFALDRRLSKIPSSTSKSGRKLKPKPTLTDYVIDFDHVIMGTVASQSCQLTNVGWFPVSFLADYRSLTGTGFHIDLDRVKDFPSGERVEFQIFFNPASANLPLGEVEAVLAFKVTHGPITNVRLKASVTMPDVSFSDNMIEFDEVICGQAKIITIQISNVTNVCCDWQYCPPEERKELTKHVPMHLRKKMKALSAAPKVFEIMPSYGTLYPGQIVNLQVKFMPMEEALYSEKLFIKLSQSTQKHFITCKGIGKEPHIEFDQSLLTFGPLLPYSGKDELVVKVTNPCSFPIEFYSLEFDKLYMEEERVLKLMKGYDEYNTILLPPRKPGEKLPKQIMEFASESDKGQETGLSEAESTLTTEPSIIKEVPSDGSKPSEGADKQLITEESVGDLEITPVSAAIASYLGIDLSVEGKAARNRRGICIIIHGAPQSGKTKTAKDLAQKYKGTVITIDNVVLEALEFVTSSAASRARELCSAAANIVKLNEEAAAAQASVNESNNAEIPARETPSNMNRANSSNRRQSIKAPKANQPIISASIPTVESTHHSSKRLNVKNTTNGKNDEYYYSCLIPDDVLIELIADRMQESDCTQGVIIDGLESMFTTSMVSTCKSVLLAINNRKYIYAVTLKWEYDDLKTVEAKRIMDEDNQKIIAEQLELQKIEEMSEGEYDALSEEERNQIDRRRLVMKKERMKRKQEQKEQEERDRKERELQEERRLEEERSNKKGRKLAPSQAGKLREKKSGEKLEKLRDNAGTKLSGDNSLKVDGSGEAISEDSDKKRVPAARAATRQKSMIMKDRPASPVEENLEEEISEEEKLLKARFKTFDESLDEILTVFDNWDRTLGMVKSFNEENEVDPDNPVAQTASVSRKEKGDKKKDKEKLKEISESPLISTGSTDSVEPPEEVGKTKDEKIPNIVLVTEEPNLSLASEVYESVMLPGITTIMDGIGVGPSGPPVPPSTVFSVVAFPVDRGIVINQAMNERFKFITAADNEIALQDEKSKSDIAEVEKPTEKKESRKQKSRMDRTSSASNKKGRISSSMSKPDSPPLGTDKDKESIDGSNDSKINLETWKHRWVIDAGESIDLRIAFMSRDLGQFDQTLNFEIVGTCRKYQLFCRGVCAFPNISREPRIVFPHKKKFRRPDEIISKRFILSNETYEFGPLLAGKNRERYREGRYPENMETITILNNSPMEASMTFSYLCDPNATTFLLEPATMFLKPGESETLTMWAYPKTPGKYEDTLVCCIKENPEPVTFKVLTNGVRPELELDHKVVQFEKVLLHRKETRTVYLRNSTLLPVAWKLNGLDNLGDDFSVSVANGLIDPMNEFGLQINFRAIKPVNVKKIIRLEVSDSCSVLGLSHAENISIQAEAYDVALDMSFPKGADGGLDFGSMRVGEEIKQTCTLKNKGKYEIGFHFTFDIADLKVPTNINDLFQVSPNRGSLVPSDRPTQVQVTFKSNDDMWIKELPILKCQIIEPTMGDDGEIIASIPVKISAKSVYSKYYIYPVNDINFGAILVNNKKTRTFVIENKSEFDFRYCMTKINVFLPPAVQKLRSMQQRSISVYSGKSQMVSLQKSRRDSAAKADVGGFVGVGSTGVHNQRLNLGMFQIYPASGVVLPGGMATVTVDMMSEIAMVSEEEFLIDISERSPTDHPNGIEYRLLGEACLPNILCIPNGISSIFEEHRIVKNLNVYRCYATELSAGSGVYGENENKFIFYNVIVGHKVKATFKITNPNKVSCDISLNVKPLSNKQVHRVTDIYDVEPQRASIKAHSSIYAVVTFQPPSMQSYYCTFEAVVEGLSSSMSKGRSLTFEMQGDGNLPRITVLKPVSTNKKGGPIIIFSKLLVGRTQLMSIVLRNDGTLPCQVDMLLVDPHQSFVIQRLPEVSPEECEKEERNDFLQLYSTSSKPVSVKFNVAVSETINFVVEFTPKVAEKMCADIRLSVVNNPFENTSIQLIGEGYTRDVTIDNISNLVDIDLANEIVEFDEENINVPPSNRVAFGDCMIDVPKKINFTISNHSETDIVRFHWESVPNLSFSPSCGHLQAKCAKDVSVTYHSQTSHKLNKVNVPCKVSNIMFAQENQKVFDWDDSKRVIHWVDDTSPSKGSETEGQNGQIFLKKQRKRRVVEAEIEPSYSVIPGQSLELELIFSANCNYTKYTCKTDRIYFKDTYIFQTRLFKFSMKNNSDVMLEYAWDIQPGIYRPPSVMEEVSSQGKAGSKSSAKSTSSKSESRGASRAASHWASRRQIDVKSADESKERALSALTLQYADDSRCDTPKKSSVDAFTIEPEHGHINPNSEVTFTVRFSPLTIVDLDAILTATIPNLDTTQECPVIALHGKSLLPWCHFELEKSNYIKEKRNPELRGPNGAAAGSMLDPHTKVMEFEVCGINSKLVRKFFIMNPTNTVYTFVWTKESDGAGCMDSFICHTPKGAIGPGKKYEIVFEYQVEALDLVESFWMFTIPDQNVSVPFLLVGYASEPSVSFDRSHINFKQLLIGHTARQVVNLINNEDQSFKFYFDESSRHAAGHLASLDIKPMKGIIPPKSKLPVSISYKPESEVEVNFNMNCIVRKKKEALTMNVKAEGFSVNMELICENSTGEKMKLSPKGINLIDFGDVEVNEKAVRQLFIENEGRFTIDFSWNLTGPSKPIDNKNAWNSSSMPVTITPESGSVGANTKRRCQVAFCPPCKIALKHCTGTLKIINGPTYEISIAGNGCPPALQLSFVSYDFGPCFVYRSGLPVQTKVLSVTNTDTKDISMECHYVNTSHLEVHSIPSVIAPGEMKDIEFRFYPREIIKYYERVNFEVNGLSMMYVDIHGEGTEMKLEVASHDNRKVNLGILQVNEKVKKVVPIVNNSLSPIEFSVIVTPHMVALQNSAILSVAPKTLISLKPHATTDLVVQFSPKSRIEKFSEEVIFECSGLPQPLFTVIGSCQGMEISLDSDAIPFGSVTQGSSSSRKLIMTNSGDIGTPFSWNTEKFKPSFSIIPDKGYISPGMELPFDIFFTPVAVSQDIRSDDLFCTIEKGKPIRLVLTGSCIQQTAFKETVHFSTNVRNRDTKNVTIPNKTNQLYTLKPIIDGEYWSGADTFVVEPQQSKSYELVYRPLTMTQDNKKHQGSIFFAIPDGTGYLHNLVGQADPPKPLSNIQRDIPCKMSFTELLNVSNWIRKPQRFRVYMEMMKPEKPDPATTFKGLDYIDVPGLSKKEYKLSFYAHKEGTFSSKITFKNEQSGEYQFYYVTFKVGSPGTIGNVDLTTPVRQSASHVITIVNPLSTVQVNFISTCNVQDVNLPPALSIPPSSEGSLTFEYQPLKSGTVNGKLTLQSNELGVYMYDLNLTATSAAPERAVHFITTLGTQQVQSCKFINYARTRVEYMSKVDSSEFIVDKSVNAASAASGGSEVNVDVTFEPSRLGDCHAILTVVSAIGGEYSFPLYGHCLPPKPQGPYTIKSSSNTQIPFKNIFAQTTTFTFHIDNPSFNVKSGETIRAKKNHNIVVSFDGNQGESKAVRMGRLVVACTRSAGTGSNLSWTYYLKGVTH